MTPDWLIARPIAHRGLHDEAKGVIENTLAAAQAAVAAGFAIECDVQLSRDGEAFVFHDDTLDRLTDATGALIELSAAAIRKASLLPAREPSRLLRTHGIGVPSPPVGEGQDGGSRRTGIVRSAWSQSVGHGATPLPSPPPQGGRGRAPAGRAGFQRIPAFAELLTLVAGRTPIVCELKSRFDRDFRIADRIAPLVQAYDGPLALKSFDPDLVAYLRLIWPRLGPPGRPCPIGLVAEASYDGPDWDALSSEQKRDWTTFEHYDCARPDFLSWRVDDLPHAIPFFVRELNGARIMAWTVRGPAQREAARKWADQIVFEGAGRP